MNRLNFLLAAFCLGSGSVEATVINQDVGCWVNPFFTSQFGGPGSSCGYAGGYAFATTSVEVPSPGYTASPVSFIESQTTSVSYAGGSLISEAGTSMDMSTSIIPAGPYRQLWVSGTITGSGAGLVRYQIGS